MISSFLCYDTPVLKIYYHTAAHHDSHQTTYSQNRGRFAWQCSFCFQMSRWSFRSWSRFSLRLQWKLDFTIWMEVWISALPWSLSYYILFNGRCATVCPVQGDNVEQDKYTPCPRQLQLLPLPQSQPAQPPLLQSSHSYTYRKRQGVFKYISEFFPFEETDGLFSASFFKWMRQ